MTAGTPISGHELRRTLEVWRPDTVDDGAGGQDVEMVEVGEVQAQVSQPTAAEQIAAAQAGAVLSHVAYLRPDADVSRGDELRGGGDVFRVKATVHPADAYAYLRADLERIQDEPVSDVQS